MQIKTALKLFIVLCRTFSDISNALKKDIKKYGLSRSEFGALEFIFHKGPAPIQDICDKVLITSGSMTYVIDQLAKKELVVRRFCENDRRVIYIHLTEKSENLMKEIFPLHENYIAKIFSSITEEDAKKCIEILKKVSNNIKEIN